MSDAPKQYPRGQISLGPGELQDATDGEVAITSNAKIINTLRKNGAGFVLGNRACTFTINTVVPETGPERNYIEMLQKGKPVQIRLKLPGTDAVSVIGVATGATIRMTLEDGTQFNVTGIGVLQDS